MMLFVTRKKYLHETNKLHNFITDMQNAHKAVEAELDSLRKEVRNNPELEFYRRKNQELREEIEHLQRKLEERMS